MSIFAKARLVVLGNANDLLDKVIDLNSPAAVRQSIRDMEKALEELRNEASVAGGQVRTLTREKGDVEGQIAHSDEVIKELLASSSSNSDAVAKQEAVKAASLKRQLATLANTLESQKQTSTSLDDAVSKLSARHDQLVSRLRELEVLDRSAKAKEHAAQALGAANKMSSAAAAVSVDNVESRIRSRADVADEKFERAMNEQPAEDEVLSTEADQYLADIKSKMASTASK